MIKIRKNTATKRPSDIPTLRPFPFRMLRSAFESLKIDNFSGPLHFAAQRKKSTLPAIATGRNIGPKVSDGVEERDSSIGSATPFTSTG